MPARRAAAYLVSARRDPLALAQHATMMGHASSPVHSTMVRVVLWTGGATDPQERASEREWRPYSPDTSTMNGKTLRQESWECSLRGDKAAINKSNRLPDAA